MAKIEIVDTSFNWHNRISYIKNLMHVWIDFTKICIINLKFSKFLSWNLSNSCCFSLCVWIFFNKKQNLFSLKLRSMLNLILGFQTLYTAYFIEQHIYHICIGHYPEILGRYCFKNFLKNVSGLLLSHYLIGIPNIV